MKAVMVLGIDIVNVEKVARLWREHGDRLAETVFSPAELLEAGGQRPDPAHLAGRFAAKEAVVKAIDLPAVGEYAMNEIEVLGGDPVRIRLHGMPADRARRLGIGSLRTSIGITADHAVAIVMGERADDLTAE